MAHPKTTAISNYLKAVAGSFTGAPMSGGETIARAACITQIDSVPALAVRELMHAQMRLSLTGDFAAALRLANAKTALTAAFAGAQVNTAARALITAAGVPLGASTVGASTIAILKTAYADVAAVEAAAAALLTAADAGHDYGATTNPSTSTIKIAKGATVDTIAHMVAVLNVPAFTTALGVTVAADGTTGVTITSVATTFADTAPTAMAAALTSAFLAQYYCTVAETAASAGITITATAATFATGQAAAIVALASAVALDVIDQQNTSTATVNADFALLVTAMSET